MAVEKPLFRMQPLLIMIEYTVERSLLNVINVEKLSGIAQLCWNIRKSILVRNHIGVMNMGKPLVRAQPLLDRRKFIVEKNPNIVRNVGNPLGIALTLLNIRESTLEKNLMNVINVGRLFPRVQPSNNIKKIYNKEPSM